jgi:hypothetical protein
LLALVDYFEASMLKGDRSCSAECFCQRFS